MQLSKINVLYFVLTKIKMKFKRVLRGLRKTDWTNDEDGGQYEMMKHV